MTDAPVSIEYRVDHAHDTIIREGHGAPDTEFDPAECHATLSEIHETIEACERTHAHVRHVVLGTEQYEQILAFLVYDRGVASRPLLIGRDEHLRDDDPHALVENAVGTDIIVVQGSMLEAVGAPTDEMARYYRGMDE